MYDLKLSPKEDNDLRTAMSAEFEDYFQDAMAWVSDVIQDSLLCRGNLISLPDSYEDEYRV